MSLYLGENLISGSKPINLGVRNIGEIVASSLPLTDAGLHLLDGSLILGGGIYQGFVDYIADLYDNTAISGYKYTYNITDIGTITKNNGVISGFSANNVANTPEVFAPSTSTWEQIWCFTTGSDITTSQFLFGKTTDGHEEKVQLQNGTLKLALSSNGSSWNIASYSTIGTLIANTKYWLKIEFTGSNYNAYISTTSTFSDTPDLSISSSASIYQTKAFCLGNQFNTYTTPWLGSIDLNESYIDINSSRWWTGADREEVKPIFCTEEQWQTSVNTYGVCGKFVYNSTDNTVRLPKVTGIIEGTTDVSALGDLVEAGLPDHYHNVPFYAGTCSGGSAAQRFGWSSPTNDLATKNASESNPIYGNSTTVQPQTIKVLYYIVIANSTKTEIQSDIDEIATDLNGKADTDLSNTTPAISFATALDDVGIRTVVETYKNGSSWYRVYSDGWCEQGGLQAGVVNTNTTVSLLKSFTDTNYSVQITYNNTDAGATGGAPTAANMKTTSSFALGSGGGYYSWFAYGYTR